MPERPFPESPAARRRDPYAGADLDAGRRFGALIFVGSGVLALGLLPLSPPDRAIGPAGWPVAVGAILLGLVLAAGLWLRRPAPGWNVLLGVTYASVAKIALLTWLAGGIRSPYADLFLLAAVFAGASHPPRRVAGVLAAIAAGLCLASLGRPFSAEMLGTALVDLLLWSGLALLAERLIRRVRSQRVAMADDSEQARALARIDPLTNLGNRRAFEERLEEELSRLGRQAEPEPLSLLLADLDDFKSINDLHGHSCGDAALRDVARALRAELRVHEEAFRWGGDEFVVLLPGIARAAADAACARLSERVPRLCRRPDGSPLTITCAAAELDEGPDELLARADEELLGRKVARWGEGARETRGGRPASEASPGSGVG